jgi:hypothetical protein
MNVLMSIISLKKRRKYFILFTLLACYGCKAPDRKLNPADTIGPAENAAGTTKSGVAGKAEKKIMGTWTDGKTANPSFEIRPDSIYYPADSGIYKYSLKKDSIRIYYDDNTFRAKIHLNKDTLTMNSPDVGIMKYWRFKND